MEPSRGEQTEFVRAALFGGRRGGKKKKKREKASFLTFRSVQYFSNRFQKSVGTPCWCSVQGGLEGAAHYQPIAPEIVKIKNRIEERLGTEFNVVLLRLYFGEDEIAWHTDAVCWHRFRILHFPLNVYLCRGSSWVILVA